MDFIFGTGKVYVDGHRLPSKPPRILRFRLWLSRLIAGEPEPVEDILDLVEDELYDAHVALLDAFNEHERWTGTVAMLQGRIERLTKQKQEYEREHTQQDQ